MSDSNANPPVPAPQDPAREPRGLRGLIPLLGILAVISAIVAVWAAGAMRRSAAPEIIQLGAEGEASPFKGFVVSPPRAAPDFTLTGHDGKPWHLYDHRGNVVAVFFGYTHCPDTCPQTLNILAQGAAKLEQADRAHFEVVLITVDPVRDTPQALGTYLVNFNPSFMGLTASASELEQVAAEFGVQFMRELPPEAQATADAMASEHDMEDQAAASMAMSQTLTMTMSDTTAMSHTLTATDGMAMTDASGQHATDNHTHEHEADSLDLEKGSDAYTVAHSGSVLVIDPQGRVRSSFLGSFTPDEVAHDVQLLLHEK